MSPRPWAHLAPHIAPNSRAAGGQRSSLHIHSFPEAAPEGVEPVPVIFFLHHQSRKEARANGDSICIVEVIFLVFLFFFKSGVWVFLFVFALF